MFVHLCMHLWFQSQVALNLRDQNLSVHVAVSSDKLDPSLFPHVKGKGQAKVTFRNAISHMKLIRNIIYM